MKKHSMYLGLCVLLLMLITTGASTFQASAMTSAWQASYFDNAELSGRPLVQRTESQIHNDWGSGAPKVHSAMPADFFSVRWIGSVTEATGQDYRLTATADDNIRVWVNADLVIDNWNSGAGAKTSLVIGLGRGTHTVRVEYREWASNAYAHFDIHPANEAPPAPAPANDPEPAPAAPAPVASGDGSCVIPESGPWPPCATGGGGGAPAPAAPAPAAPTQPEAPAAVVPGGLLAYYAFDEANGGAIVDGAANVTGSISANVTRIRGARNNGLRLGANSSIFIPNTQQINVGTGDFTIGMWTRSSQGTGVQRLMDKRTTSPSIVGYHLFTWDGKLGMQLGDGGGTVQRCKWDDGSPQCTNYITEKFIADGQWHHIMVTVDRNASMRFYVDGVMVSSMSPTARQGSLDSASPVPLVIDAQSSPLDVDEFLLYNRALGAGEVARIFNNR